MIKTTNIRSAKNDKKINVVLVTLASFLLTFSNLSPVNAWVLPANQTLSGSSSYGGAGNDQGNAIADDGRGNLYTTGTFSGTSNFDSTGTLSLTSNGGKDIYISKVNYVNGDLIWVKSIGGALDDQGLSIAAFNQPPNGGLYITGTFEGTVDFNPGAGTFNLTSAGGSDIFILFLDLNGNFQWAKRIWGPANSKASSITLSGLPNVTNIYITGSFDGKVDFNPDNGTYYLNSAGRSDVFILKLTASGSFVWAKRIGSAGSDAAYSVFSVMAENYDIYLSGTFESTVDFNPGPAINNLTADANGDTFILKLSAAGLYIWGKKLGGVTTPIGLSGGPRLIPNMCASQGIFLVGSFEGREDFDPHPTTVVKLISIGGRDVFIAQLTSTGSLTWAKSFGGFGNDEVQGITLGDDCLFPAIYATGSFEDKVDFDPSQNITNLTSNGGADIFVTKFFPNGQYSWAKHFGGPNQDIGYSIFERTDLFFTGSFQSIANFQLNGPPTTLTSAGGDDIFISALNQFGN